MSGKHWHLVSYDVRDAKRLRKVAKTVESYGSRLQYSVFRCRLDRESLEKLHWELSKVMDPIDDLLIIPLCDACSCKVQMHSSGDRSDWGEPPASFRII
jgi:CRISPR-associated protein Cas2